MAFRHRINSITPRAGFRTGKIGREGAPGVRVDLSLSSGDRHNLRAGPRGGAEGGPGPFYELGREARPALRKCTRSPRLHSVIEPVTRGIRSVRGTVYEGGADFLHGVSSGSDPNLRAGRVSRACAP
jgi:hypothetical protein